ncbi:protein KASH5 isoform X2 [Felis catus]|uniref:protein KASH5 isoform X2 n=1 Tax=Felis catus TaxID=9685 RepID=UPI001D1A2A59|nr:protein KASH5 isoform X2 [Felis catus]
MDKGSLNPTGPWHPSLRPERGPRRRGRRRPSLPLPAALPLALALPADTRAPARPGWVRARTVLRMRGVPGAGALGADDPLPVPPSDGGRLLVSPAAVERPGWPMDVPEGQAGGPAAKMYLWDQLEEGSLGTLLSLEEQILNSTFEACDPQRTGIVTVTHVLAYLEAVTGRGSQDARLQTLACNLDPNGEGPQATVDLDTFLVVMRDWIAACQLDGGLELEEETAFEGALTSQQPPSGCPEAEEPANLESFGGEDPRPELRTSCPHHPHPNLGKEVGAVASDLPLPDPRPATADLLSSLEDLELSNRRLAGENAKLQRSVETAEEGSARLGEEIAALRKQLRRSLLLPALSGSVSMVSVSLLRGPSAPPPLSTQQALQCAKAVDEELEDLKTLAKSLEEQNRSLLAQARQTEKEQQHLVAEMETLQEENGKLLAERDGVKRRSEELATEKDALKVEPLPPAIFTSFSHSGLRQLFECERLICQRDAVLSERTQHAESLAKTLEEYRTMTQELRLEISHLEEQLSQIHEGPDELPEGAQVRRAGWTQALPPSLGVEIQAIRQKQEVADSALSSPLCGVWQWEEVIIETETDEEAEFPPEAPAGAERNFQGEPAHPQGGRKEQSMWLPRRQEEEEAETQVRANLPIPLGDPHPGDIPGSLPESPAKPDLQRALVPVVKELVPVSRPDWGQLCLAPLHPQPLRVTRHPLIPAPVLGLLLLLLLSVLLLGQSPPPTWPHLQLCYLQPPPV